MSVGPQIPGAPHPFSPNPGRPKLRVKLEESGPFVDLGISYSELIVGILDTLNVLVHNTHGAALGAPLVTALSRLDVYRRRAP